MNLVKPTLPTSVTRLEWVKMFYPDAPQGIAVGVVHQLRGEWVFYRRTDDTAFNEAHDSPMGLDVGTYRYLSSLDHPPVWVDFLAEGASFIQRAAFSEFAGFPPVTTLTTKNLARTRIFLPRLYWQPIPLYNDVKPKYWAVTHLQEDGTVIARYVPR